MEPTPPLKPPVEEVARAQLGTFGVGFRRPITGLQWLVGNPGSWPFAVMPMVIFSILAVLSLWFSPDLADLILGWIWSEPRGKGFWDAWVLHPLWTFCWTVFFLLSVGLGIVVSFVLSVPLAGPFLEMLCERHEESCTGQDVPFAWKTALLNPLVSLAHVSLLLAMQIVLFIFSLLVGLIPVLGPPLSAAISAVVSVLVLGLGLLDYPMTLRLWSLPEKFKFVRQSGEEFVGFSLCCFVLMYIPVLNLLLVPACVLGANQMVVDWEAERRIEWEDRRRLTQADESNS